MLFERFDDDVGRIVGRRNLSGHGRGGSDKGDECGNSANHGATQEVRGVRGQVMIQGASRVSRSAR
jgi:hypothetical protein